MNIVIKVIPHGEQRYETVGDWWRDEEGTLQVRVSDLGRKEYAALVAIHEVVEALLCEAHGVAEVDVSYFDEEFEGKRAEGSTDEPGDDPDAPYRDEHCVATGIERVLCGALGLSWKDYEEKVNAL